MNGFHFAGMPGGWGWGWGMVFQKGADLAPSVKGKLCRQQKPIAGWEGRCKDLRTRTRHRS